jgi:hypothetical protein
MVIRSRPVSQRFDYGITSNLNNIAFSDIWKGSCVVVQPHVRRSGFGSALRKRRKAEAVKIQTDDLIAKALSLSIEMTGNLDVCRSF